MAESLECGFQCIRDTCVLGQDTSNNNCFPGVKGYLRGQKLYWVLLHALNNTQDLCLYAGSEAKAISGLTATKTAIPNVEDQDFLPMKF